MVNSEGDESDSLIVGLSDSLRMPREQVQESSWMSPGGGRLAWEDMKLDVCIAELPEQEKVGKIKALLRYVGIGKSDA